MKKLTHSPERWKEIQSRFDEVVLCDPETRATRLMELALEDPELEREIRLLLDAYERTGEVLGRLDLLELAFLPHLPEVAAGTVVGPYEILEEIGRGGMGIIYKARDARLSRLVALKFLPVQMSADPLAKARFMVEAKAASALDHPNICTIHETGETDDGQLFIAMAYYEGRTLSARIADGPLPLEECLSIARQIADGLARAHEAGIVHRDIKPSNVMLTERGEVKILDFGLAKLVDASLQTRAGTMMGTAVYMSPEQTRSETVDHRSDLWSLGVLMYEIVTGRRPFRAANEQAVIFAVRNDEPERASSLRPELSPSMDGIIHRLLEKDPNARYAAASELAADLLDLAAGGSVTLPRRRRKRGRPLRKVPVVITAAAALLLAAIWMAAAGAFPELQPRSILQSTSGAIQISQVWTGPDVDRNGSPSPNGRLLTFTDWESGDLAVRNLATGEKRRLTDKGDWNTSEYAHKSVVSHDGRMVAYSWYNENEAFDLRVVGMDGSSNRVLYAGNGLELINPYDWSRDGSHVLAMIYPDEESSYAAFVAVADGAVQILKDASGRTPLHMALSPNGRYVVFDLPQDESSVEHDVFIFDTQNGTESHLVSHPAHDFLLGWMPSGEGVLFASDRAGTLGVYGINIAGGRAQGLPALIRGDIGRIAPLGFSAEGKFFFSVELGSIDVYRASLDPVTGQITAPELINPRYTGVSRESAWSPDGTRIAYIGQRGYVPEDIAPPALVIRSTATGQESSLFPRLKRFRMPQWSPDGASLLLNGMDGTGRNGYFLLDPLTGDHRVLTYRAGTTFGPEWSHDGESIFMSKLLDSETGARQLVRVSITNSEEQILQSMSPPLGSTSFSISKDGQFAVFVGYDPDSKQSVILLVDLVTGTHRNPLPTGGPVSQLPEWSPDDTMLYFVRDGESDNLPQLWRISVGGGEPEYTGLEWAGLQSISIHPEGRQISFTAGETHSEIWVMENFLN